MSAETQPRVSTRCSASGSRPSILSRSHTLTLARHAAGVKAKVHERLTNKYVFVGDISLRVVLYLDEQKMLERPSYGDIDNHAKQLLDTIKGHGGLLINDSQVQHIDISWIDVHMARASRWRSRPRQTTSCRCPYASMRCRTACPPLSEQAWTTEGLQAVSVEQTLALAHALEDMTRRKRTGVTICVRPVCRSSALSSTASTVRRS